MRAILFLIFFFTLPFLNAQGGFKSRFFIPNTVNNFSKAIFETSPGNYIAAGFCVDSVNGGNINRIVIMGLGSSGQMLWYKKFGSAKLMYLDNGFITRSFYKHNNNLYYAGCVLDSVGKYSGVLIKFNLNGDTLWQKIYRDPTQDVVPQMVTTSVDGGFLITGYSQPNGVGCLLIKTSGNGNELWRKKIAKPSPNVNDGKAILQDSASKKIAIVGYQYLLNNNNYDNLLVLDSLGNWLAQGNYCVFGGEAKDLIQTKDKKMIMVGWQYYPQTIGGLNLMKSVAVKFDVNDPYNPIWKINGFDKLALSNGFTCLRELSNGDLLVGGIVDTIGGVLNGPSNIPESDLMRLTKITSNGIIKWNHYYNYKNTGTGQQNIEGIRTIELCQDGGWVASIEGFNYGRNPFFFVKYDSTGCDSSAAYCATVNLVGIQKVKIKDEDLKIYPNPVNKALFIESRLFTEGSEFILKDVLGREMMRSSLVQKNSIDVSVLQEGVYFLSLLKGGEFIYQTKIIKRD